MGSPFTFDPHLPHLPQKFQPLKLQLTVSPKYKLGYKMDRGHQLKSELDIQALLLPARAS